VSESAKKRVIVFILIVLAVAVVYHALSFERYTKEYIEHTYEPGHYHGGGSSFGTDDSGDCSICDWCVDWDKEDETEDAVEKFFWRKVLFSTPVILLICIVGGVTIAVKSEY